MEIKSSRLCDGRTESKAVDGFTAHQRPRGIVILCIVNLWDPVNTLLIFGGVSWTGEIDPPWNA